MSLSTQSDASIQFCLLLLDRQSALLTCDFHTHTFIIILHHEKMIYMYYCFSYFNTFRPVSPRIMYEVLRRAITLRSLSEHFGIFEDFFEYSIKTEVTLHPRALS